MEISNKNSGISIIDSIILFFEINIKLQVYVIPFLILAAYFEYNGSKITYLSIKELGTVVCLNLKKILSLKFNLNPF